MIIYGKPIADTIYQKLEPLIKNLKKNNITPTLTVILVGNNPQSTSYVSQKKKSGEAIGINVYVNQQKEDITEEQLKTIVSQYNSDPNIHGIIIQLPLPQKLNEIDTVSLVDPSKDVDGFLANSVFTNPLAKAVLEVLKRYVDRFNNKKICVIGKGKTGGAPIYRELQKLTSSIVQIDTKTSNPDKIIYASDIVISCTGKKRMVNGKNCKKGAVLISCGLHVEGDKLKGDYEEDEIKDIASYYTPTPAGIGPVNVASLLENVVKSAYENYSL